jgi:hypothetical protein
MVDSISECPKPLLNRTKINTGPEGPRRERGTELVQPKILFIQFRMLSDLRVEPY